MDEQMTVSDGKKTWLEQFIAPYDNWMEYAEAQEANDVRLGEQVFFVGEDGEDRPAVVVRTWKQYDPNMVNLCVYIDGTNDPLYGRTPNGGLAVNVPAPLTVWKTSVHWALAKDKKSYSWHY